MYFFNDTLEPAQWLWAHDKLPCQKQSLSEIKTANISLKEINGPDTNVALFLPLTLNLPK